MTPLTTAPPHQHSWGRVRRCRQRADGDARPASIVSLACSLTGCHSNPLAFLTQVCIGGTGVAATAAAAHRHSYRGFVVQHYVRRVTFTGSITMLACAVPHKRMMGNVYRVKNTYMYILLPRQFKEGLCCYVKVICN